MAEGIDFSWGRPGGPAIKAAGKDFVIRYVPYPGDQGKGISQYEIWNYRKAGLDIGFVFESTAGRMAEGAWAGKEDAITALAGMQSLGVPDNVAIYFACDYDVPDDGYASVYSYLQACKEVLGEDRVGVYAKYDVIQYLAANGGAKWRWQTYAWSYELVSDFAHVLQYQNGQELNGELVDYCRSHVAEWGQWKASDEVKEKVMTESEVRQIVEQMLEPIRKDLATLNKAVSMRVDIMELANGPYYDVLAAWGALKDEGYLEVGDDD